MIRSLKNNQKGFTIVELMISSAVFSLVLLLCTIGIIQVGRLFYKGTTSADTQEVARSIMADITSAIQLGGTDSRLNISGSGGAKGFCFGNKLYSYITNKQLVKDSPSAGQSKHVISQSEVSGNCASVNVNVSNGTELMSVGMRLAKLDVSTAGSDLYRVNIVVISGDGDLIDGGTACKNERGSQFCATAELTTTVQRRK